MCKDQHLAFLAIPVSLVVIKRFALTRCCGLGIGQESSSLHSCLYQNLADHDLVGSGESQNSYLYFNVY